MYSPGMGYVSPNRLSCPIAHFCLLKKATITRCRLVPFYDNSVDARAAAPVLFRDRSRRQRHQGSLELTVR